MILPFLGGLMVNSQLDSVDESPWTLHYLNS
jgi:hypothetical protein